MKTLLLIGFLLSLIGLITTIVYIIKANKKQELLNEENSKVKVFKSS